MKNRNPLAVLILWFVTVGIYGFIWYIKTGREMRSLGATIPTAWLTLIPFAGIYQWWKWCGGVAHVTRNNTSAGLALLLTLFLGPIGYAIIQSNFNSVREPQA